MKNTDTFWITLPTSTWKQLFERSIKADSTASEFLRILIEDGHLSKSTNSEMVFNPAPEGTLNRFRKDKKRR